MVSKWWQVGLTVGLCYFSLEAAENPASKNQSMQYDQEKIEIWKKEAARLATEYVKLLDQGLYAQSWEKGGPLFQEAMTQADWIKNLDRTRRLLGLTRSRTLQKVELLQDPYHLLKGIEMAVKFQTSFEKDSQAQELLILQYNPSDRQWHVNSYELFYSKGEESDLSPFLDRSPSSKNQ